jgi:hypothetical protein
VPLRRKFEKNLFDRGFGAGLFWLVFFDELLSLFFELQSLIIPLQI